MQPTWSTIGRCTTRQRRMPCCAGSTPTVRSASSSPVAPPSPDDHRDAARELAATGAEGRTLAPVLGRLLARKSKSQYQTTNVGAADARRAIEQAARLYDAAHVIVTR